MPVSVVTNDGGGPADTTGSTSPPTSPSQASAELDKRMDKTAEYIISEPYVTIPDEPLSQFLTLVYNFSKKEGKTTEAETKEAVKAAEDNSLMAQSKDAVVITGEVATIQQTNAVNGATEFKPSGGRRLTRKRIFKLKKNRRITRIRAPFKSAAVAVAAFRRK